MASVKMPDPPPSTPCQFRPAWRDECGEPSDNGWCDKHEKLTCASCGQKATTECNAQMGGLCCGAPLCDNCTHAPSGYEKGHITNAKAEELYEEEKREEETKIASRSSPEQRLDKQGRPKNLLELLKGPETAYEIKQGYWLQLEHGLMGFFPAIFADDRKRLVITLDKELIVKVWRMLSPRRSKIGENLFYVVKDLGVAYANIDDKEMSEPDRYLTQEEFDQLTADESARPFAWAPGLLGADMSEEDFIRSIEHVHQRVST